MTTNGRGAFAHATLDPGTEELVGDADGPILFGGEELVGDAGGPILIGGADGYIPEKSGGADRFIFEKSSGGT